jgi:hypothetical protein
MPVQTAYTVGPRAAFAGMLANGVRNEIMTLKNADVVSMPFGAPVAYKTTSPASDRDALMLAASGDKLAGIVVHSHDYARTWTLPDGTVAGELDGVGLTAGTEIQVLWFGEIWVKVQTAVAVNDPVFVSYSVGTTYTAIGQYGNVTEASKTIALTNAIFTSSSAAGGFAKVRLAAKVA